ncbi:cytochrome c oxidase subunit II [Pantanalinema sp. GBBB05]|uniref:cytochrome c oxidase subunit II n=1 Tax=Pantanalinema sp. GBBB05 TaxID=2604139 RepID=UPI001DC8CAF2|nr:cytochrome c oxidase subunit II [Pantanalinema sp. GBBB05]
MPQFFEYFLLTIFIAGLIFISHWIGQQAYTWMPPQATAEAQRVDDLFSFLTTIGAFILLGLVSMMLYSVLFYRAKPDDYSEGHPSRGNAKLEIFWTITPILLVAWIAFQNINIYKQLNILGLKQIVQFPLDAAPAEAAMVQNTPKPAAETIQVIAKQWNWRFRYPNDVINRELHLPVNESTRLNLQAEEVIHGFYIPEFRLRQDAIPGRDIAIVVTPIRTGKYRLQDAEFSGTYFALMQADVYVESREAYERWLARVAQQPIELVDAAVAEQSRSPRTLLKTGWYTGLSDSASVADSLSPKDGGNS